MALSRRITATAAVAALAFTLTACGSDDDDAAASGDATTSTSEAEEMEPAEGAMDDTMPATVVDIAAGNDDFSTLVAAVEAAGLVETLSGEGPFTVFAPVNDAFDALPEGTVDSLLLPENQEQLTAVLTYHVVPTKALSGDLTDGMTVTTVQGEDLTINIDDDGVTLTDAAGGTAMVVQADLEAGNGVVHVIDAVLMPAPA